MAGAKAKLSNQNCERPINVSPEPLLLPDEYCLAEGRTDFEISCDRIGGQRGCRENVYARLTAQVYITNDRIIFVPDPTKRQKYHTFSICIESIENYRLDTGMYSGIQQLRFEVRKTHGPIESITSPRTAIGTFFPHDFEPSHIMWQYKECQVKCEFIVEAKTRMFFRGIDLLKRERSACRTGKCRFIDYEDLPAYSPTFVPVAEASESGEKLPNYSEYTALTRSLDKDRSVADGKTRFANLIKSCISLI